VTGNQLSICLKTRESPDNLRRDGQSQDLTDTYRLLVNSPSEKGRREVIYPTIIGTRCKQGLVTLAVKVAPSW
jgi:hypothetical protein